MSKHLMTNVFGGRGNTNASIKRKFESRQHIYDLKDEEKIRNENMSGSRSPQRKLKRVNHHPLPGQLKLTSQNNKYKEKTLFNDSVHVNIEFDGMVRRIIDTPEFQRLSHLKQLGTCDFVFRGATHSRFEHSIGVCHLAERVCLHLQSNQPELDITENDISCVKLAGLCHDLGHGPFSHVFDGVFIKKMYPNGIDTKGRKWRHEDGSVAMFQHLLTRNSIVLSEYGLTQIDQIFIEEIIGGDSIRQGRPKEKHFLYDIVNNTKSGLDVDKLDYFQRDMKHANVGNDFSLNRFINLGKVLPAKFGSHEEELTICYPEKLVDDALDLFRLRFKMHRKVYTHKAVKKIEYMKTDAFVLANDFITIPGTVSERFPTGRYKISECIFDSQALSKLDDRVEVLISLCEDIRLEPAKKILERIENRQLYICLGKTTFKRGDAIDNMSEDQILENIILIASLLDQEHSDDFLSQGDEFCQFLQGTPDVTGQNIDDEDTFASSFDQNINTFSQESADSVLSPRRGAFSCHDDLKLLPEDLIIEKMHIHYGLKDRNPVEQMRFYKKQGNVGVVVKEETYESQIPRTFEDMAVRVFCRHYEKENLSRRAFEIWCKRNRTHSPFPSSQSNVEAPHSFANMSSGIDDADLPKGNGNFPDACMEDELYLSD